MQSFIRLVVILAFASVGAVPLFGNHVLVSLPDSEYPTTAKLVEFVPKEINIKSDLDKFEVEKRSSATFGKVESEVNGDETST